MKRLILKKILSLSTLLLISPVFAKGTCTCQETRTDVRTGQPTIVATGHSCEENAAACILKCRGGANFSPGENTPSCTTPKPQPIGPVLTNPAPLPDGIYTFTSLAKQNKCMDLRSQEADNNWGTVQVVTCNEGNKYQKWQLKRQNDGFYTISSLEKNRYLFTSQDINYYAQFRSGDINYGYGTRWEIIPSNLPNVFHVKEKESGRCLDARSQGFDRSTVTQTTRCNDAFPNNRWIIRKVD